MTVESVLAEVTRLAPTLHKAGTFSARTLEALVRHATARPVQRSVETGSGASTLLLSHISPHHTVFAMDAGTGSVRHAEASPLLRRETVTFVEGPTQLTLPRHIFTDPLQLALIDGPHGYPFPDLEYYFLYPHLEPGALLIVDDIHIPTITNLFDFLSVDDMFHLEEVVETTAFFRRTSAETFPPTGDGWWDQRYNKRVFESSEPVRVTDGSPAVTATATPCHVDQLGGTSSPGHGARVRHASGEDLIVAGWALDAARRQPAAAVDLVLDGAVYRTDLRVPRADVASVYGDHAYFRSGFNARIPAAWLAAGNRTLEVRVVVNGGRECYVAARYTVEIG